MNKGQIIYEVLNEWVYNDESSSGEILHVIDASDIPEIVESLVNKLNIDSVSRQREPFINFTKDVIGYYEEHCIGDEDIYNKAKKLINGG